MKGINSWQWAKHGWLYFDLLQTLKGGSSAALGSKQRES